MTTPQAYALIDDPDALVAEMRRQSRKPHVADDHELSLLLGVLLGRYLELLRASQGKPS